MKHKKTIFDGNCNPNSRKIKESGKGALVLQQANGVPLTDKVLSSQITPKICVEIRNMQYSRIPPRDRVDLSRNVILQCALYNTNGLIFGMSLRALCHIQFWLR